MIKKLYQPEFETVIEMGSVESIANDKEPTSVLDYLTKVWENASEPEDNCVPGGSVVIARNGSAQPDYHVWTTFADVNWTSLDGIRIVSSPHKVGFYLTTDGYAYYWDGSTWCYSKGGGRCGWQGYGFSNYIGDVKEDK